MRTEEHNISNKIKQDGDEEKPMNSPNKSKPVENSIFV
jgi:hypothetical protein